MSTAKISTPSKPSSFLWLLLTLYIAQGLPVGFMTQALPALLRHYGVSLAQIGFSGLLMLPWAIKFLWSPWIDRKKWQRLQGHYRAWIVLTQGLTLCCVVALAFVPMSAHMGQETLIVLFMLLFLMNLFCATQDIATDALAVNHLQSGQLQWGNSIQVMGSRLGFILGGGAILFALDWLSWKSSFLLLSFGILLNSLAILRYQEPLFNNNSENSNSRQSTDCKTKKNDIKNGIEKGVKNGIKNSIKSYIHRHYTYLWSNAELKRWLFVLVTYKIADGLASPMIKPMMVDMGLKLGQIGLYITMIGAGCALVGAAVAAMLIKRFSLSKMFMYFALLQSLGLIYYVVLAYQFERHIPFALWHLYMAHAVEETLGTMTLVALLSLIMQYARPQHAGSDFTVQTAVMTMVSGGLHLIGGVLAQVFGYSLFLQIILVLSLLALAPKWYWFSKNKHK